MSTRRFMREVAQQQVIGKAALEKVRQENAQRRLEQQEDVPKHVQELIERNELEDATIIFSQKAVQLFCHLFSNSMESAVERGLKQLEDRIEHRVNKVVEQQLTKVFLNTSSVLQDFLDSVKAPIHVPESTPEPVIESKPEPTIPTNIVDMIIPHKRTPNRKPSGRIKVPNDKNENLLGNSSKVLKDTAHYLLEVFTEQPNVPIKLSEACRIVKERHNVMWSNPTHILTHVRGKNPSLVKEKFGFYVYKE